MAFLYSARRKNSWQVAEKASSGSNQWQDKGGLLSVWLVDIDTGRMDTGFSYFGIHMLKQGDLLGGRL